MSPGPRETCKSQKKRFARDLNYKMLQQEMKYANKDQRLTREEVCQTRH